MKKGDWVLVHAAAGGVGLLLCQMLKAVGAHVIGTASTEEKMELARKNGAQEMINYKTEADLVGKVKEFTGGEGVAVVYDSTGKDQFENDLEVVRRKGSVISYGNSVSCPLNLGKGDRWENGINADEKNSLVLFLPWPFRDCRRRILRL